MSESSIISGNNSQSNRCAGNHTEDSAGTSPSVLLRLPPKPGGGEHDRIVIGVRSRGCVLFRNGGGCLHCGLRRHPIWAKDLAVAEIVAQFQRDFAACTFPDPSTLCLYSAGSLLDADELPPEALRYILRSVAGEQGIRCVNLESRPEFCLPEHLQEVRELLGDRRITVGLGFESASDTVRNRLVGKQSGLRDFQQAIARLHEAGMSALCYILVKPPSMSEGAALQDAWMSLQIAFTLGADAVSLEPMAVQRDTALEALYARGEYRPPWLWTIVELARLGHACGEVLIGGEVIVPPPIAVASNCPQCDTRVLAALREFDRTQQLSALAGLDCACRQQWEQAICAPSPPTPLPEERGA